MVHYKQPKYCDPQRTEAYYTRRGANTMFYLEQSTDKSSPSEQMTDEELGFYIIGLLGLKVKSNGRVDTSWGGKTPIGLAKSIKRIVNDSPPLPGNNRA